MLCLLLLLSPALLSPARGMTEDGMRGVIISSGNPMAGNYRTTEDGAMATPAVRPGTEMGRVRPTGEAGCYVGELFTRLEGTRLTRPKKFTLKASGGSRLLIIPKKSRLRIQLWKLLPYMFRAPVSVDRRASENAPEGLSRVWPQSPSSPPPIPSAL